jgi:hypothetical protein
MKLDAWARLMTPSGLACSVFYFPFAMGQANYQFRPARPGKHFLSQDTNQKIMLKKEPTKQLTCRVQRGSGQRETSWTQTKHAPGP